MKISDFQEVSRLMSIRKECDAALDDASVYEYDEDKEATFEHGFSFVAGQHSDQSGFSIDMKGCYVAAEATRALIKVLQDQLARVDARLTELGVEV